MPDSVNQQLKEILSTLAKGFPVKQIPQDVICAEEIAEINKYYSEIGEFVRQIAAGNLKAELPYKGPLAGSLKMLQASLKHLTWQAEQVANGDFTQHVDFLGDFADSFNTMVSNLNESFKRVEEKNNELLTFKSEFDKDIKLAEDAQNKMMQFVSENEFSRAEKYFAALQRVSGDFFHEYIDDEGNLNIFAGDATGHGVSAGLVTMMARTALESAPRDLSPQRLMEHVNNLLVNCLPDDMYISGLFVKMSPKGVCQVSSAGHFPAVIARNTSEELFLTGGGGMPLGMFDSEIADFEQEEFTMFPGDRIYFFTDGVVECRSSEGQFGVKRLHDLILKLQQEDLPIAVAEIIGELWEFCAEYGFEDDVLLLVHEYKGLSSNSQTSEENEDGKWETF